MGSGTMLTIEIVILNTNGTSFKRNSSVSLSKFRILAF
jgi:hypothetical protein